MKNLFLAISCLSFTNLLNAQCEGRYQTEIFSSVNVTTLNYSDVYNDIRHEMDIYTPNEDTVINRPVVIYIHGGGFTMGNKNSVDCVDFCESFARRGYVAVSMNYRLSDYPTWMSSNKEQLESIMLAVFDSKAAVRYLRKDFENGNNFGIDTSTIFLGGYSAGGVTAIHHAYLDSISDLSDNLVDNDGTIFNMQSSVDNIGGIHGLEGDAGNYGYSSKISGVISFAAGIVQTSFIDQYDEPLVSVHGTFDQIVSYYCWPGFSDPSVITICGPGIIHPHADSVGIINDQLVFMGEGHFWPYDGNINPKFIEAVNFTNDFLYQLLPCSNNILGNDHYNSKFNRNLIKTIDILGREQNVHKKGTILFYVYDDGTVEKKIIP
tara:strand:- start:310 stop:1443 length:1134 start_codon:yes stop_codon:yes gene_type:complete